MAGTSSFEDLATRLASAVAMLVVGLGGVWLGGYPFLLLVAAIVALMVWELARMSAAGAPRTAHLLAGAAGVAVALAGVIPIGFALPLLLLPGILGMGQLEKDRAVFAVYAALICVAGLGLWVLRNDFGFIWMLWLALVVIATDVFGYFAGRIIGGPKFWPRVSPKKTWSGTVAGWVASGVVGALFMLYTVAGSELVGISIALSMAAQMGDIAESAIKRRAGVKDSSSLIPGHGGLLDRFDGMLGASVLLLLVEQIIDFPPLPL